MFIDEVTIDAIAGDGGDGCVAFRREKYTPHGGPSGGNGGKGGDVILVASEQADTLYPLARRGPFKATRGQHGMGKEMYGSDGEDMVVEVPVGTIACDAGSGEVLRDLDRAGMSLVVAKGGQGGKGNARFATATRQVPRYAQKGGKGEHRRIRLELKLMANVGILGLPNAGKSTLLARLSAARPRIAGYPFTTLAPQLGIVDSGDWRQLVMADLPGLIEGAHAGAGLGDEFLRHIERTSILLHVVDAAPADGSDPVENFRTIRKELALHSRALAARPQLVALNKMDLPGAARNARRFKEAAGTDALEISAVTGKGLGALKSRLFEMLEELRKSLEKPKAKIVPPHKRKMG